MTVTAVFSSTSFTWDVATETSYNSGTVGTDFGALGIGASFTSYELDNAWTEAYQIGQRTPEAYYTQGLQAVTNIDFLMCQDQIGWLQFVLGSATGGTYTVGSVIASGMIKLGTPQGNSFTIGGIAFASAKIAVTQGGAVKVSLAGTGTSFTEVTGGGSLVASTIPTSLITWKDVTVNTVIGVGTIAPTLVQELDFTINTGAKLYYALGSPQYQAYLPLQSQIECNITAFHQDTNIQYLYNYLASQTPDTVGGTVVVNLGTHTATFTGCYLKKGTLQLQPVTEAVNQLTFRAINVTIV